MSQEDSAAVAVKQAPSRHKTKKKKQGRPKVIFVGVPEWMYTYSDMMSLLLTFFILLFSIAETKQSKINKVYKSFGDYFDSDSDQVGYTPRPPPDIAPPGLLGNSSRLHDKVGSTGQSKEIRRVVEKLGPYASIVEQANHLLVVIPGLVLFESGKANLRPESIPTLLTVAGRLAKQNLDFKIVGHTSSVPLGADAHAKDHFSLGFLRALAVGKFFSGADGDLTKLARQLLPDNGDGQTGIRNLPFERFIFSSPGWNMPNPSRENLWENPDLDDRVEIMFLTVPPPSAKG